MKLKLLQTAFLMCLLFSTYEVVNALKPLCISCLVSMSGLSITTSLITNQNLSGYITRTCTSIAWKLCYYPCLIA